MIFDANILTSVPTDWTIVNGNMSNGTLLLTANGTAKCSISTETLASMPDAVLLSFVANKYADPYAADIFAIIQAISKDGISYTYNVPIVDTGGGLCSVQIPTVATEYTSLTFTFRTGQTITITDWNLFPPKMSDVDLTDILDKIPRLLKDYNETSLTVAQTEETVAMICSYVTEATELAGHFTLTFKASEATSLIVRVYDNDIEELYAPLIFYVNAGYGTIGIPHAYLTRLKGYHNFAITVQALSGSIVVDTRRVMYVIDGGRLVYSVMDVGSLVSDLALRKLFVEDNYSFIYAVCIDNGTCIVKKCPYSETPGAAWVADATIGPALDASIEFDGYWTTTETPYRFTTEEFPYIAWVAPDNTLYVKKLNSADAITFATSVTKVCSVKGWDNVYDAGYDQGLIFAYVKTDGTVYYRGFCRQTDNTYAWEVERIISSFSGVAVDVNAFRTNDFRIGFNILDNAGTTHTYITNRNYSGMSIQPVSLNAGLVEPVVDITEIKYIENTVDEVFVTSSVVNPTLYMYPGSYVPSSVVITLAKRIDDYHIRLTCNTKLTNVAGQQARFTVENKTVTTTSVGSSEYEIILTTLEALPAVGMYPTTYTKAQNGVQIKVSLTECDSPPLEAFSIIAQGDPPEHTAKVAAGITTPVVTVTYITYKENSVLSAANITAGIASPLVTITQVGSSPL